jgi:uncharacterized Zn-binding protein involved in type VI secretion
MAGVVREDDLCSGHAGFPPRAATSFSSDVKVNGKGVVRLNDTWANHCNVTCHTGTQATASSSVKVNGVGVARIGDTISCGSTNANGSSNVLIN